MKEMSNKSPVIPSVNLFLGRENEQKQIQEFLANKKIPILLVYGLRGVGKTTLVSYIANENKDKFSVIWIDRSDALELFQDKDENTTPKDKSIKSALKNEKNNPQIKFAEKILFDQSPEMPWLLVIDDFDEEYTLLETKNDDFALCNYLERLVNFPNKVIITSRLRENSFKTSSGYKWIEIGLLQKQDVFSLVNNCFANISPAVLVESDLNKTSNYIWTMSGGLAESVCGFIIPIITEREYLIDRDKRFIEACDQFSQCYLSNRQQPPSLDGYEDKLTEQALESLLISRFENNRFTEFVLWKWLNLNLTNAYEENDLGLLLGLNLLDNETTTKLHDALLELYKHRFIARRIEDSLAKWILLPIISSYLKKYWPASRQYWNEEVSYLRNFIEANINTPLKMVPHVERVLAVITWCGNNKSYENLVLLGVSTTKAFEKIIHVERPPEELDMPTLIDISKKTADVLEHQSESGSVSDLVKVLLVLAKFYSSDKINVNRSLAHEFAKKALGLAAEKQIPEEIEAIILTAKTYIYLGELEKAGELLENAFVRNRVNEDWVVTVSLLVRTLQMHSADGVNKIYSWCRKIVNTISSHKMIDFALQSVIDVSKYCYQYSSLEDIADILSAVKDLLQRNKEYIEKSPYRSIQLLAYCSFMYERKKDLEQYKSLLQDAIQVCKEFGYEKDPIFNILDKRLIVVTEQGKDKTLFDELIEIPSIEPLALDGFDVLFVNCPICKRPLGLIEVVSCTFCGSKYHRRCLTSIGSSSCLSCKTELNLITRSN